MFRASCVYSLVEMSFPHARGDVPKFALAACAKRMSLQDWLLFSERAAIPGLLAKTDAAHGTDAWNRLVEMLRAWGRDWRGIVDRNTELTTVSLNGNGTPPMPALVDRMDRAIAALYRGADLSTISKGEGLGASLQGEEADMLEADDCAALAESLHEQVDRYVIRWATGDAVPLAYIWIEPTAKPDIQKEIAIDTHLAGMGARLSLRDALQRYGRAETDPKDPSDRPMTPPAAPLGGQTPLQNAADPLQNARRLPNERGGGENADASEGVLAAFARDTSKAAAEVRKLLALVDAGKTQEAASFAASLAANLPALLPDDPAMAGVIADEMARAFGEAWEESHAEARRGGEAEAAVPDEPLANEITNPCPKCHRQMAKDGTCSFCAKRAANHAAGKAAFAKVADTHQDVVGAMERDSIGKIDFIWGDKSEGVCHILDGHSETANQIPGVIAYGDVYENAAEGKYYVVKKRYVAVLRKQTGSNHYLITGFRAESPNYVAKIRKEYSLVEKGE